MEKVAYNRQKKAQGNKAHSENKSASHTSTVVIEDSPPAGQCCCGCKTLECTLNLAEPKWKEDTHTLDEPKEKENNPISNTKRVLTDDDNAVLTNLENSFIVAVVNSEGNIEGEITDVHGLVNMSVLNVQKFVNFFKLLDEFKSIAVDIQASCMKAHMLNCLVLYCIYIYDAKCECFNTLGLRYYNDALRKAFGPVDVQVADKLIDLCKGTQDEFFKNPPLQAILYMVLLFSPEGNVKHQQLSNLQDKYLILLKHYLESKYSFRECKSLYVYLLQKLQTVKSVADSILETIHQIDPAKIEPLMKEVLNFEK